MAIHKMSPNPNLGDYFGRGLVQGLQNRYDRYQEQERERQKQHYEQEQMQSEMRALKEASDAAGDDYGSKLNAIMQAPVSNASKTLAGNFLKMEQQAKAESQLQKYLQSYYGQGEEEIEDEDMGPQSMQQPQGGLSAALSSANGARAPMMQESEEPESPLPKMKTPPHLKSRIGNKFQQHPEGMIAQLSLTKPQTANILQKQNDIAQKNRLASRKEKIEFHKESNAFDEKLREDSERAEKQLEVVKDLTDSIDSGKITPWKPSNLFRKFGATGETLSNAFLNAEQGKFQAAMPYLLEGWKQVFGARLSDADLKVIQDKLPDIGKSPEANKAILKIIKKYAEPLKLKYEIAKQIKKENEDLRPLGFADKVSDEFARQTQKVKVRSPSGKIIEIEQYKIPEALKKGGEIVQ